MIGYLNGKVKFIFDDYCILSVNGVGYKIYVDDKTLSELRIDDEKEFFIHTLFKDDSITLYGFNNQTDYKLFIDLIKVSGIGAKTALNVLSKMTSKEFVRAIYQKNISLLTNLPGIGKKSAQRLILELKDKIEYSGENLFEEGSLELNEINDATEALISLGYTNAEIAEVFSKAKGKMNAEELIKFALKELNKF